uniref:Protocadherin gamma-C3 n=1 Tax=Chelydra serpentina TaxID=8475 RepID=A0A8C3RXI4_CHESE
LLGLLSLCGWGWVSGQIRYSVVEESELGTVVGNVAQDLGLKVADLSGRRLRLGSEESRRYFAVSLANGALLVNEKIDRESLCGASAGCVLPVQVIIESPLELFRLEVEILDLNDNSPSFPIAQRTVRIAESATVAARFPLESAQDPDVGTNTVRSYRLSPSPHFSLNVKKLKDGKLFPELVLEQALDREENREYQLVLTAIDGGNPARSGTAQITVIVMDINDNAPLFDQSVYKVSVPENTLVGTLLIQLNATDPDEGPSGEVQYSFAVHTSDSVRKLFDLDPLTGAIRVQGAVDFEEAGFYEIHVRARDGGVPEMESHCVLQVEVEDLNDNTPEVLLTSLLNPVEDAPPGTVVAVIHVKDRDSGEHGKVQCHLPRSLPFKLRKDFEHQYSLLTSQELDRECVSQYNVTISASDLGIPSLSRHTVLSITLADINDNTPQFERASYEVVVKENNQVGEILVTVSATDPDLDQNSRLSYSVLSSPGKGPAADPSVYTSINPTSGQVFAKLPFDYEQTTYFQFQVEVSDGGSPALSSRTVVHLFVTDQNDNAPGVQFPLTGKDSIVQFRIPRSTSPQALITKIIAVDLDSGRNAWLSYHLIQATDPSLFGVTLRSGEIRTTRALQEQDAATQELFLVVKDSGEPPMSTSVTVLVLLEENAPEAFLGLKAHAAESESAPRLTLYLIISLATISALSLAALVGLGVQCVRGDARAAVGRCVKADTYQPSLGDATIDVQVTATAPPARGYRSCFSPVSDISEFMFIKPSVSLGNTGLLCGEHCQGPGCGRAEPIGSQPAAGQRGRPPALPGEPGRWSPACE